VKYFEKTSERDVPYFKGHRAVQRAASDEKGAFLAHTAIGGALGATAASLLSKGKAKGYAIPAGLALGFVGGRDKFLMDRGISQNQLTGNIVDMTDEAKKRYL